jgi:predicted YcjX-like family ATPase
MSAESPGGKNDSIQTSKEILKAVQKDKVRKTSSTRPISKARAQIRYGNDESGKVTLDDGTLHTH